MEHFDFFSGTVTGRGQRGLKSGSRRSARGATTDAGDLERLAEHAELVTIADIG